MAFNPPEQELEPEWMWDHRRLLLGQQVISQHLVLKVVVLQPLLGSRLGPLHLRPQRVHVEGVCGRGMAEGTAEGTEVTPRADG